MVKFVQAVKTVTSVLPALADAVKAAEALVPGGGAGAEKLKVVEATLRGAYRVSVDAEVAFDALWPALSGAVSGLVGLYNTTGIFKTSKGK